MRKNACDTLTGWKVLKGKEGSHRRGGFKGKKEGSVVHERRFPGSIRALQYMPKGMLRCTRMPEPSDWLPSITFFRPSVTLIIIHIGSLICAQCHDVSGYVLTLDLFVANPPKRDLFIIQLEMKPCWALSAEISPLRSVACSSYNLKWSHAEHWDLRSKMLMANTCDTASDNFPFRKQPVRSSLPSH